MRAAAVDALSAIVAATTRATRSTPSTAWPRTCSLASFERTIAPQAPVRAGGRGPVRAADAGACHAARAGGRRVGRHRRSDRRHARPDVPEAASAGSSLAWRRNRGAGHGDAARTSGWRCRPRSRSSSSTCADQLWAVRGQGVAATRLNRLTGERCRCGLQPSRPPTHRARVSTIVAVLPGVARGAGRHRRRDRGDAARAAGARARRNCSRTSTSRSGGQLYELMSGHDRFVADLRPLFERRPPGGPALVLPSIRPVHRAHRARVRRPRHRRARAAAGGAARRDVRRRVDRLRQRARCATSCSPRSSRRSGAAVCWHERRDPGGSFGFHRTPSWRASGHARAQRRPGSRRVPSPQRSVMMSRGARAPRRDGRHCGLLRGARPAVANP